MSTIGRATVQASPEAEPALLDVLGGLRSLATVESLAGI